MTVVKYVQKHNQELHHLVENIKGCLANEEIVRQKSSYLSSLVKDINEKSHLSFSKEDKMSLIKVLKDSDEQTREEIQTIINENLKISKNFNIYSKTYEKSHTIQNNPEMFIKNSMDLYSDLMQRMKLEEKLLKPLSNKLH
jgi:predicted nucleic-acid-binding protein